MHPKFALLVKEELQKLVDVGFVTPIYYPTCMSNVILVVKKLRGINICIDFRDINKAFTKDDSPLGHQILSLMDGFSDYNQICISKYDQHKISFKTP